MFDLVTEGDELPILAIIVKFPYHVLISHQLFLKSPYLSGIHERT